MPDSVVIDASVGIAHVRTEAASTPVRLALRDWAQRRVRLVVPSLFWIEALNSLGRRHGLTLPEIAEAFHELDEIGLDTVEVDRPLLLVASAMVGARGLTAYDACYLALAETLGAPLVTLDRRLAAAAGERGQLIEAGSNPRRLAEPAARYGSAGLGPPERKATSGDALDGRWPGFGAYLAELRARDCAREQVADRAPDAG